MKTRAVVINAYGGKENLEEAMVELPELGDNQLLVRVKATSINPIDWKVREGYLQQMMPWTFPITLGWDVAGVVEEIGSKVQGFKVGDRIVSRPATTRFGTYADVTIVDASLATLKPEKISYSDAAALPLAGLTAYQGLFDHGKLEEGQKVLIHAGAGGVGMYAIQLAKAKNAYVYTTASEKNHELLKELGADEVIDYHQVAFDEVVTNVDVVLDTMGGEVQLNSIKTLKPGGRLVSIVGLADEETIAEADIEASAIWLQPNGEQLKELIDLMEAGSLRSIIGATFPLTQEGIYNAHALSETHHAVGKIVVVND